MNSDEYGKPNVGGNPGTGKRYGAPGSQDRERHGGSAPGGSSGNPREGAGSYGSGGSGYGSSSGYGTGPGQPSDSSQARSAARAGKESLEEGYEEGKERLREGAEYAKREAKGRAESLKADVSERAEDTADALDSAARELGEQDQQTMADAVGRISARLRDLAGQLEHKSLDELLHDGSQLAQRNPLLFLAGSIAAGAMLSRLFKARQPAGQGYSARQYRSDWEDRDYGDYGPSSDGSRGNYGGER
jgi:uncharacterized protein YjbJ (UPF0337 family)